MDRNIFTRHLSSPKQERLHLRQIDPNTSPDVYSSSPPGTQYDTPIKPLSKCFSIEQNKKMLSAVKNENQSLKRRLNVMENVNVDLEEGFNKENHLREELEKLLEDKTKEIQSLKFKNTSLDIVVDECKEKILALEEQLQERRERVQELISRIKILEADVKQKDGQLEENIQQLKYLKQIQISNQEKISSQELMLNYHEDIILELKNDKEQKISEVNTLNEKLALGLRTYQQLEDELVFAKSELKNATTGNVTLKHKLIENDTKRRADINAFEEEKKKLKEMIDELSSEKHFLQANLLKCEDELAATKIELETKTAQNQNLKDELEEINAKRKQEMNAFEDEKTKLNEMIAKLKSEHEEKVQEFSSSIKVLEADLKHKDIQLEDNVQEIKSLKQIQVKNQERISSQDLILIKQEDLISELKNDAEQMNSEVSILNEKLSIEAMRSQQLEDELASTKNKLENVTVQNELLNNQLVEEDATRREEMNAFEDEKTKLNEVIAKLKSEQEEKVEEFSSSIKVLEADLEQKNVQLEENMHVMKSLKEIQAKNQETISLQDLILNGKENLISQLKNDKEEKISEVNILNEKLSIGSLINQQLEDELAFAKNELEITTAQNKALKNELVEKDAKLREEMDAFEDGKTKLNEMIANLKREQEENAQEFSSSIKVLEADLKQKNMQLEENIQEIKSLKQIQVKNQEKISSQDLTLINQEDLISELRNDAEQINFEVGILNEKLSIEAMRSQQLEDELASTKNKLENVTVQNEFLNNQLVEEDATRREEMNVFEEETNKLKEFIAQLNLERDIAHTKLAKSEAEAKKKVEETKSKCLEKFNETKAQMLQILEVETNSRDTKIHHLKEEVDTLKREKGLLRAGTIELNNKIYHFEQMIKEQNGRMGSLMERYNNLLETLKQDRSYTSASTASQSQQAINFPASSSLATNGLPLHNSSFIVSGQHSSHHPISHQHSFASDAELGIPKICQVQSTEESDDFRRLSTCSTISTGSAGGRQKVVPDGSGSLFQCADEEEFFPHNAENFEDVLRRNCRSGSGSRSNRASSTFTIPISQSNAFEEASFKNCPGGILNEFSEKYLDPERASELLRRNSFLRPQLKSSYPTEQVAPNSAFSIDEDKLKGPEVPSFRRTTSGTNMRTKIRVNPAELPPPGTPKKSISSEGRVPFSPTSARVNNGDIKIPTKISASISVPSVHEKARIAKKPAY